MLRIRKNVPVYFQQQKYQSDEPWIDESWAIPSNIVAPEIVFLKHSLRVEGKRAIHFDLENVKTLYAALKHLSPAEASNERLWSYLTHSTFWKYMHSRWPIEATDEEELPDGEETKKKNPLNRVETRYFLSGQKAPVRNGLARLWWFGYTTYDEALDNPWELTENLLHNSDLTLNLVERNFSRNLEFTKAILSTLADIKKNSPDFYNRDRFRELMKYFNFAGGMSLVDLINLSDVRDTVRKKLTS
ncbi:DUF6339 family protein [Paenibacillus sp. GP183]|uniref:DUF6339 family protein n=1 Tax=Paenibacillus sp. GP183 TaxID=1882751 RepID=UPI000B88845E|nr:DUF6339 family protein [Paenibacillus sp. GP183]